MKYPYGSSSVRLLEGVIAPLRKVFYVVADVVNTTILPSTIRTQEQQKEFLATGKSTTLNSKHLKVPSEAVDAAPYPVDWRTDKELWEAIKLGKMDEAHDILHNIKRWFYFKGVIAGAAKAMDIPVRGGEDWDQDQQFDDQKFIDLPHTEYMG